MILLMTALHIADAALPPDVDVSIMHMLTVVGKVVMMSKPSAKPEGMRLGNIVVNNLRRGTPMQNGQKAKSNRFTRPFSLKLEAA